MKFIQDRFTSMLEVKKSKFYASLFPLQSIEDVALYLQEDTIVMPTFSWKSGRIFYRSRKSKVMTESLQKRQVPPYCKDWKEKN